jgi:hypothetical protein
MLSRAQNFLRIRRSDVAVAIVPQCRYHSFPDPNEKPQISVAKSDVKKTIDKNNPQFRLQSGFRLDSAFPGVPSSSGIKKQEAPETSSTVLKNGLTVATQDTHGLMSSIAFLAHTGRLSYLVV